MSGVEPTLREVVEHLAPLHRRAGSPDERQAARWIAERLRRGGAQARVEEARFHDGYARQLLPLSLVALAAGALALRRGRSPFAAAAALAATAAIVDDVSNGTRVWRRATARAKTTWNVVAEAGDRAAPRTLVVLAHHDAAQSGLVFDQRLQRWAARRFPRVIAHFDTSLPLWWPVAAAPALVALGALTGDRRLTGAGLALSAVTAALGVDIARRDVVPGANDNLSAVAALVALAEGLRDDPPPGVRVLLVSCGAEEVLQGGIYGFAERHFGALDGERTWFLNLDTIGSPELIMLEGEGCFVMEEYPGPAFRDLVARAAERAGAPLRRGCRARSSTDAVIPSRAGYPTATLSSWDEAKCLTHYHQPSDLPENLRYDTIARAVAIAGAVTEELAGG